ncbi:MAG: AmmeMemoRadiSam system protein A [Caldilineae bacterium]|nr:MAG: AmmeMemoRadiSam system protein A [Caldilineae bacterium]
MLQVARQSLMEFLSTGRLPTWKTDNPVLLQPRAVFVTLRNRHTGELRGCRGESVARRPLIEAVAYMSLASALDDPRFPPVTLEEAPELSFEINMLTPLRPIRPEEVEVGRHGLMIVKGYRRGLLLPEVPVHYGWDRETFLAALCRKAGLPDHAWRAPDAQLFGFESQAWSDEDFD